MTGMRPRTRDREAGHRGVLAAARAQSARSPRSGRPGWGTRRVPGQLPRAQRLDLRALGAGVEAHGHRRAAGRRVRDRWRGCAVPLERGDQGVRATTRQRRRDPRLGRRQARLCEPRRASTTSSASPRRRSPGAGSARSASKADAPPPRTSTGAHEPQRPPEDPRQWPGFVRRRRRGTVPDPALPAPQHS